MKAKSYFIVILMLILSIILTACSKEKENVGPINSYNDGNRIVIGVSILDMANPYYVQIVEGIKKEAETNKIEIILDDPKSDVKKQVESIDNFIKAEVDAIIITAIDSKELEPVLDKAMKMGIKVVAQSTKVENCDIFVSSEEWNMGHTIGRGAGRWINERLNGKAEVAILNYPRILQIANREKGIIDGIAEFAPAATIVATEEASSPEEGKKATIKLLRENPNIKVIVGINDGGALGALEAYEYMGKIASDVFIGGVDATPEALKKIKNGTVYRCTVDISPYSNGKLDVDFVVKLLKGQIVPNRYNVPAKLVEKNSAQSY